MLTTTELIILKGVKCSDTSSIVHTYSEQFGSLSLKASRTPSSRRRGGAGAFFIPLSILSVTIDHQPKREIFTPREYSIVHTPKSPSIDPVANAVTIFSTELLNRILRSDAGDSSLYTYIRERIIAMDQLPQTELSSFHLGIIIRLLHHLGILPQVEGYKDGFVLDYAEGHFRHAYSTEDITRIEASMLLAKYITTPNPESIPITREQRNALLDLLLRHLTYHFPEVGTLHSPQILSQLF